MRLPNGYGSVIKLSGKRRKPYAVRITTGYSFSGGRAVQKYKYLEYFEKRKEAMQYLADYNAGREVKEHVNLVEVPTFAEIFERWLDEREKSPRGLSDVGRRGFISVFKRFSILHNRKITSIRFADVQPIIYDNSEMSNSTVDKMKTLLHAIAAYAIKYEYITQDFSAHIEGTGKKPKGIHQVFTPQELQQLWADKDDEAAAFALLTCYTGLRPSEALFLKVSDEDLNRQYVITKGSKTDAGRNRVIPLHPRLVPVLRSLRHENDRLFTHATLAGFVNYRWNLYMDRRKMDHLPHDGRHTCATLMEQADIPLHHRKLILGHKVNDVTTGIYTHVSPETLIEDISRL